MPAWQPAFFVYEALLQEPETYAVSVFEEVAERWGKMLYNGATTFWETDNGAEGFLNVPEVLCHAWELCFPTYLYGAYVLGIKPIAPGVWATNRYRSMRNQQRDR